jgi:hypothetical protein
MSSLVPRRAARPVPQPDRLLNIQVADAERGGITAVARIQAGAFATSVAVQNACMLAQAAEAASKVSPMGKDVYESILMTYGSLAVAEIQGLGFGRGGRL